MEQRNRRKERIGVVVSDKMEKSAIVKLVRTTKHPVYGRVVKKARKVMIHDEKKEAKIGDTVKIQETKPLSKNKRWRLTEVLKQS